jgi:hypothetical protein
MDALKRSDDMEHFKGRIFLSRFEAGQALTLAKEAPRSKSTAGKDGARRTSAPIEAVFPPGHAG